MQLLKVKEAGHWLEEGQEAHWLELRGHKETQEDWVEEEWEWNGGLSPGETLPPFTRSIRRRRPGENPAGITTCIAKDLGLGEADSYRFPPYTHKPQYLLSHKDHKKGEGGFSS